MKPENSAHGFTEGSEWQESLQQQRQINERDLREIAHYYGGWSELRKVIDELEKEDNTLAGERYYSKP